MKREVFASRERWDIPKAMPGLSSRTWSRLSLAKNMYAERPRLGALGSATGQLCALRGSRMMEVAMSMKRMRVIDVPFFFFSGAAAFLPLRGLASLGMSTEVD